MGHSIFCNLWGLDKLTVNTVGKTATKDSFICMFLLCQSYLSYNNLNEVIFLQIKRTPIFENLLKVSGLFSHSRFSAKISATNHCAIAQSQHPPPPPPEKSKTGKIKTLSICENRYGYFLGPYIHVTGRNKVSPIGIKPC